VLKTDRLVKIAVSAMKQSQRATLPLIGELTDFDDFVGRYSEADRYICHCHSEAEAGRRLLLNDCCQAGHDALVLIGPEGDFSLSEVEKAKSLGYTPVTLGDMRLRTETAALVAGLTLQMKSLYSN
jgi:16S rRNA (uracil1498-N3)-methyltransferase